MMQFALLLRIVLAVVSHALALPQLQDGGCDTVTKQVIVPTKTATYSRVSVVTLHPTTAMDLGTFTYWSTLSSTITLQTLTNTITQCQQTGIVSMPEVTSTRYVPAPGSGDPGTQKRELGLHPRQASCTVTSTSYTTYGQTYTLVPAGVTSTYYQYSHFTQSTVTRIATGGRAFAIATDTITETACATATVPAPAATHTVTMDSRCAPEVLTSAFSGYGIDWLSDVPASGATFVTTTPNASACCQRCATAWQCAVSAWDIRTGECRLEFATNFQTGAMNCGQGLLGYYDAGPSSPMSPGTGWYIAELCGRAAFGASQPDDGS